MSERFLRYSVLVTLVILAVPHARGNWVEVTQYPVMPAFTTHIWPGRTLGLSLTNLTGQRLESVDVDYSAILLDVANLPWNVARYDGQNGGVQDGAVTLEEFIGPAIQSRLLGFLPTRQPHIPFHRVNWRGTLDNNGILTFIDESPDQANDWLPEQSFEITLTFHLSLLSNSPGNLAVIVYNDDNPVQNFVVTSNEYGEDSPAMGFAYELIAEAPEVEFSYPPQISIRTINGANYLIYASDTIDAGYESIGSVSGDGARKTFIDRRTLSHSQFYIVVPY